MSYFVVKQVDATVEIALEGLFETREEALMELAHALADPRVAAPEATYYVLDLSSASPVLLLPVDPAGVQEAAADDQPELFAEAILAEVTVDTLDALGEVEPEAQVPDLEEAEVPLVYVPTEDLPWPIVPLDEESLEVEEAPAEEDAPDVVSHAQESTEEAEEPEAVEEPEPDVENEQEAAVEETGEAASEVAIEDQPAEEPEPDVESQVEDAIEPDEEIAEEPEPEPEADVETVAPVEIEPEPESAVEPEPEPEPEPAVEVEPEPEPEPAVVSPVDAPPPSEMPGYAAGENDLESLTCDECVYIGTCPNSEERTPSACGSFQWRSG